MIQKMVPYSYLNVKEGDFICEECNGIFSSLFELAEHGNVHTGNQPFVCQTCSQKFKLVQEYVDHYKATHTNYCPLCGMINRDNHILQSCTGACTVDMTVIKEFPIAGDQRGEVLENSNEGRVSEPEPAKLNSKAEKQRVPNKYTCESCSQKFSTKCKLKRHECFLKRQKKTFVCSCLATFRQLSEFRAHLGSKPYSCCSCKMMFTSLPNLTKHIRSHTKEKPYVCQECNRAFTQTTHLSNHMSIHKGERAAKCQLCDFSCRTPGGLFKHMKKHKSGMPVEDQRKVSFTLHECSTCGKMFRFRRNLAMHLKSHSGAPYPCPHCGQLFLLRPALSLHLRTTHGQLFKCSHCDKEVRGKLALRYHIKTHNTSKKFECLTCGRRFTLYSYLRAHSRTHDTARPLHTCTHCAKQFKVAQSLRKHYDNSCPVLLKKQEVDSMVPSTSLRPGVVYHVTAARQM